MMGDKDIERIESGPDAAETYEAVFRFPTEQYAYIEIRTQGTPESLISQYDAFQRHIKGGNGLADKDFDLFIEKQISGEKILLEQYNSMSLEQQKYVQVIKRAIKRIKSRIK